MLRRISGILIVFLFFLYLPKENVFFIRTCYGVELFVHIDIHQVMIPIQLFHNSLDVFGKKIKTPNTDKNLISSKLFQFILNLFSVKCRIIISFCISDFLFHFWKLKKKFSVFTCILLMECSFSPNFLLAHQFWVCSAQDPVNTILVLELMEAPCSPLFWASVILDSLPQEWNRSSARFGQEREEKERWRVKMGNASPHLQLLPGRKQGLILWQNWEYQLNI